MVTNSEKPFLAQGCVCPVWRLPTLVTLRNTAMPARPYVGARLWLPRRPQAEGVVGQRLSA